MKTLLIVDDDRGSRESLRQIFNRDYKVLIADSTDEALERMKEERISLVITDLVMPERDGIELLDELQARYPGMPVIMVSGHATVRPVVKSIRKGAYDFISKPFEVDEIQKLVRRAIESSTLIRNIAVLREEVSQTHPVEKMVGSHPLFTSLLNEASQAAETASTVLISGESGTGKELLARYIHANSVRRQEPFIVIHCGSLESRDNQEELFGMEQVEAEDPRRIGHLDLADSGTLFLEEVGECSPDMQTRMLRLTEQAEYQRIGGKRVMKTSARIMASTTVDLEEEIQAGRFRRDLLYRLNVIPLSIPALRDRSSDIPQLADFFLRQFRDSLDTHIEHITPEAMNILEDYFWPGNIRELRNVIERISVLYRRDSEVLAEHLPDFVFSRPDDALPTHPHCSLEEAVSRFEKQLVVNALKRANGVQTRAAEMLGTTRRILKYRMEKLGVEADKKGK